MKIMRKHCPTCTCEQITTRLCGACMKPLAMRRRDQRFCNKQCRERVGYHRRRLSYEGGTT